jgi:hypothetical protein
MSRKHISTQQVLQAIADYRRQLDAYTKAAARHEAPLPTLDRPVALLMAWTGEPAKVCERAIDREERNGYIDSGVSVYIGWLTPKGEHALQGLKEMRGNDDRNRMELVQHAGRVDAVLNQQEHALKVLQQTRGTDEHGERDQGTRGPAPAAGGRLPDADGIERAEACEVQGRAADVLRRHGDAHDACDHADDHRSSVPPRAGGDADVALDPMHLINRAKLQLVEQLLLTSHPELQTGAIVTDVQAKRLVDRISELIECHVVHAIETERERLRGNR